MKNKKTFPFIRQSGMMDCGAACLAMIFKHYGYYNIQGLISQMAEISTEGSSLYDLSDVAEQFGFQTEAYEMNFQHFEKVQFPCIAHYEGVHFIVVYKISATHVWIADPAYGKDQLTKEEFIKKWNGIILTVEPTPEIFRNKDLENSVEEFREKRKSLFGRFYKPTLLALKPVIYQILAATALLQILGLALPFFTQTIVDYVLVNQNRQLLMVILWAMLGVFLIQVLFLYVRNILLVHFRVHFEMGFFSNFFKHFISLSQRFYDANKREDFMYRFQENITIRQLVNPSVIESVVDLLFVLLYLPVLIVYNTKLGLIGLGFVVIYFLITAYFTPRIRAQIYKVFYRNLETLGAFLDTLLGMQTVKLLALEQTKFWQWKNKYKHTLNRVMESEKKGIMLHSIQRSLYYISQIAIFWVGAYMTFQQEITIGQFLAITSIFLIVLNALNNLSVVWYNLTELSVSLNRINDVLLQEQEEENKLEKVASFQTFPIQLQDLHFKYEKNQTDYILSNIDLTIEAGEHIGIVGRNGSGKTTLVKLLANLYPHYEGCIRLGSHNLQEIQLSALRRKIFLFPQEVYIFNGTILENIRYGNPDANLEEVMEAARLAGLSDYIHQLYLGYNQQIGDLGTNLSGGERLKIGFARLFLCQPDLIILDEASSMLDPESEQRMMENLRLHFSNTTIISIAHRLNTLRNADRILVLDEGQIIESGNHASLIDLEEGVYAGFMKTYVNY